jgi:predicted AAA+ superfamily ATPase
MEELEVLKILRRYNPWWENREIPPSKIGKKNGSIFKRRDFFPIMKSMQQKEITSIIGPRRVGKTILVHQIIDEFISSNQVKKSDVLYLSMDATEFINEQIKLNDILEIYAKHIIKTPLDSLTEKVYVFLDEIQTVPKWHLTLKNWFDIDYKIKFIISGSSSLMLSKGSKESLHGRVLTFILFPLKFCEILRYNNTFHDNIFNNLNSILRGNFKNSVIKKNINFLYKSFESFLGEFSALKDNIEKLLSRYIIVGGYPEFLDMNEDYASIGQRMREKIRFIFYTDIIKPYKIRNTSILDELFSLICKSSTNKMNIQKTAATLGVQRPTLLSYLKYLEDIFLVSHSEFFSSKRTTRIRKQKKVYVNDSGMLNATLDQLDELLLEDDIQMGIVVEGIVFDHLKRLKFIFERGAEPLVFYWGENGEVDFIIEFKRIPIPFEVKYRNSITRDDKISIEKFLNEYKSPFGILITKNTFNLENNIISIPLWMFLLMI